MKKARYSLTRTAHMLAAILVGALFTLGCSLFDTPTASTAGEELSTELWSPKLGDEIQPGVQVPIILDDNYWNAGSLDGGGRGGGGWRLNGLSPVILELDEDGGTVQNGRHYFVIPAGAISVPVNFTLEIASGSGIAVDCGPSPFFFNDGAPARLYLSYEGTQYDSDYAEGNGFEALDPNTLNVWYDPQDGSAPQLINSGRLINSGTKTVSAEVDHFSRYILG